MSKKIINVSQLYELVKIKISAGYGSFRPFVMTWTVSHWIQQEH